MRGEGEEKEPRKVGGTERTLSQNKWNRPKERGSFLGIGGRGGW